MNTAYEALWDKLETLSREHDAHGYPAGNEMTREQAESLGFYAGRCWWNASYDFNIYAPDGVGVGVRSGKTVDEAWAQFLKCSNEYTRTDPRTGLPYVPTEHLDAETVKEIEVQLANDLFPGLSASLPLIEAVRS